MDWIERDGRKIGVEVVGGCLVRNGIEIEAYSREEHERGEVQLLVLDAENYSRNLRHVNTLDGQDMERFDQTILYHLKMLDIYKTRSFSDVYVNAVAKLLSRGCERGYNPNRLSKRSRLLLAKL